MWSSLEKLDDESVDSDIKQYEEIRKLSTRQRENYTTGCFYIMKIKNQKSLSINSSWFK